MQLQLSRSGSRLQAGRGRARWGCAGAALQLCCLRAPPQLSCLFCRSLQIQKKTKKPVVVVLGFGWGAHALIKVGEKAGYVF